MNYRSVIISSVFVIALFCIVAVMPVSDAETADSISVSYVGYDSDSCTLTISGAADFETVHIGLYQGNSKLTEAFASVKDGSYTQSIYVADFGSADTLKVWNGSAIVCETVQFVKVGTVDYDRNSKLLAVSGTAGDGAVHLGIFGSDGKKVYEFFATASGGEFFVKVNLDGIAYGDYLVKAWNASASMISQKSFKLECPQYSVEFRNYDGTVLSKEIYDLGTEASKIVLPDEPVKTGEYWGYIFAGWDSKVADVTADAVYTAVFTEIPVHTIAESTYDLSTDCVTVSGTSGSDLVHIGIYSDGKKLTEAYAAVKDNSYSVVISLSGMAFDTVKVWDASVSTVASSAISGITSVSYDNMTQVLTVAGVSDKEIVHIGIWSGNSRVLEAFAAVKDGAYRQDISLEGLASGKYSVKVWDASAEQVCSEEFEHRPIAYVLNFADGITVKAGETVLVSGTRVLCGTELTVSADTKDGYTLTYSVDLIDGKFVMPEKKISITATYTPIEYTFVFMNGDEKVAETKFTVETMKDQTMPAVPVKDGYNVTWDVSEFSLKNRTVHAVFAYIVPTSEVAESEVKVDLSKVSSDTFVMPSEKKESVTVDIAKNVSVKVEDASGLAGKNVTVKAEVTSVDTKVSGTAYELTFEVEGNTYNGSMLVTLPYTQVNGERPVVYYYHDGTEEMMEIVSYDDTSVTFKTSHNSVYVVSSEQVPESDDMMILAVIAVVVILFIIGMLYFIRRTEKQAQ